MIGGDGPPAAIESIKLNAAALAINGEVANDWPDGAGDGGRRMTSGEPARLIERMRGHGKATAKRPGREPSPFFADGPPVGRGWPCS